MEEKDNQSNGRYFKHEKEFRVLTDYLCRDVEGLQDPFSKGLV